MSSEPAPSLAGGSAFFFSAQPGYVYTTQSTCWHCMRELSLDGYFQYHDTAADFKRIVCKDCHDYAQGNDNEMPPRRYCSLCGYIRPFPPSTNNKEISYCIRCYETELLSVGELSNIMDTFDASKPEELGQDDLPLDFKFIEDDVEIAKILTAPSVQSNDCHTDDVPLAHLARAAKTAARNAMKEQVMNECIDDEEFRSKAVSKSCPRTPSVSRRHSPSTPTTPVIKKRKIVHSQERTSATPRTPILRTPRLSSEGTPSKSNSLCLSLPSTVQRTAGETPASVAIHNSIKRKVCKGTDKGSDKHKRRLDCLNAPTSKSTSSQRKRNNRGLFGTALFQDHNSDDEELVGQFSGWMCEYCKIFPKASGKNRAGEPRVRRYNYEENGKVYLVCSGCDAFRRRHGILSMRWRNSPHDEFSFRRHYKGARNE